jgi:hypothetical protein
LQLVKLFHSCKPEFLEDPRLDPLLEAVVGGGLGTEVSLIERFPLAAGAQDIEDGVGAAAVGYSRAATAEAVEVQPDRDERFQHCPERIGDAEGGGGAIIRSAHASALG